MSPFGDAVIISDPGGAHASWVSVVATQVSWALNNVGTLSTFCRLTDLSDAGWDANLDGTWIEWGHPTAGRFGGLIAGQPTITDGIVELSAEDWAGALRGRVIDVWIRPQDGSPAGLARGAVAHALRERPTFVTVAEVQEAGAVSVQVALGGQDLLTDVLPALTSLGLEWFVDADRALHLGRRIGVDRSNEVTLYDNHEILTYQRPGDTSPLTPGQLVEIESARKSLSREVVSQGRQRRWTDPRLLHPRDRPEGVPLVTTVTGATPLTTPFSAQVADVGGVWGRCQIGDTVRVVLGSARFDGLFRIVERSLDTVNRVMTLAGEITPEFAAVAL